MMPPIYLYKDTVDEFASCELLEKDDQVTGRPEITGNFCQGISLRAHWKPPKVRFEVSRRLPLPDFSSVSLGIPLLSERAWKLLAPILGSDAEALPVASNKGSYLVLNVVRVIQCLDHRRSVFRRYDDGWIASVDKYVFKPGQTPPYAMFLMKEIPTREVFVSQEIYDAVLHARLTGLELWPLHYTVADEKSPGG